MRSITDPWEISQDAFNNTKPPEGIWVQVKCKGYLQDLYLGHNTIIEAMAVYPTFGKNGIKAHWKLRDGTCHRPSKFSYWRYHPGQENTEY